MTENDQNFEKGPQKLQKRTIKHEKGPLLEQIILKIPRICFIISRGTLCPRTPYVEGTAVMEFTSMFIYTHNGFVYYQS